MEILTLANPGRGSPGGAGRVGLGREPLSSSGSCYRANTPVDCSCITTARSMCARRGRAAAHSPTKMLTARSHHRSCSCNNPIPAARCRFASKPTRSSPRLYPHSANGTTPQSPSRDFVPWRFSDAGCVSTWMGRPQTLTCNGPDAYGPRDRNPQPRKKPRRLKRCALQFRTVSSPRQGGPDARHIRHHAEAQP